MRISVLRLATQSVQGPSGLHETLSQKQTNQNPGAKKWLMVKALDAVTEDSGLIPSAHMATRNHL